MSDFNQLQDFNDYLDTRHHVQKEIVAGSEDTGRVVIKAEHSYTMRELLCSLLAGKGLKLPNVQMCLSFNIKGLLGNPNITGALQEALHQMNQAFDEFLDHTNIDNVLNRINAAIQEAAQIANLINFCGTPIAPKAIPNMLEGVMESFLGKGQDLLNQVGGIIPENIGGCASLGQDGSFSFDHNLFSGGILKDIGDTLASFGSIPSQQMNTFTSALNQIQGEFTGLMARENQAANGFTGSSTYSAGGSQFTSTTNTETLSTDVVYEIETLGDTTQLQWNSVAGTSGITYTVGTIFKATGGRLAAGTGGTTPGTVCEVNMGMGVLHNANTAGVQGNARLASNIKNAYDQVGGYPVIAQDGTVYANVFELLLEPEMLGKVRDSEDPTVLAQTQTPVYDYCGNIIGYTFSTTQGTTQSSTGIAPTTSSLTGILREEQKPTAMDTQLHTVRPGTKLKEGHVTSVNKQIPKVPSYTTAQRNELDCSNGDMILNTDTNEFQGFINGNWVTIGS